MIDSNQIPDDLLRQIRVIATKSGESLEDFITEAIRAHLERRTTEASTQGWRSVFGKARREEVEPVDALIAAEFKDIKSDQGW